MVKTGQFTTKVHAVYRSTIQSSYWCRHICPVLISTYDTHYLFIRPVFTARMYGCIWAVCMVLSFWHPFDTCTYGCRNMHPYVRSVQTGRTYGCIFRHPVYIRDEKYRPMPNVMAALSNIGGALCSTPQSLADAQYLTAVQ